MARKIKDLVGMKFRKLTVVAISHINKHVFWLCECDCGNTAIVAGNHLQKVNGTSSCGCARATHGKSRLGKIHPMYRVWLSMRERCNNTKCKSYPNYGGRGIYVSKDWDSFEQFLSDMGERPEGKSLDRVDNNGPYNKENCRWATPAEQIRNTRVARWITYEGETKVLTDWANKFGLTPSRLFYIMKKHGENEALKLLFSRA